MLHRRGVCDGLTRRVLCRGSRWAALATLAALAVLDAAGCITWVPLEVVEPAEITVPAHIVSVAVVDHSQLAAPERRSLLMAILNLLLGSPEQLLSLESDRPTIAPARRARDQLQDAQGRHRLAASRLTDHGQRLLRVDRETEAVHRLHAIALLHVE